LTGDRLPAEEVSTLSAREDPLSPQVDLIFDTDSTGRTWMRRQRAAYPFHVGRSWHVPGDPEGMLTLYLQSCSGGLFQQDVLGCRIVAKPGAKVHATTAASTVVHTMDVGDARQHTWLEAQAGGYVEYLPDPMILFPGARLHNRIEVHAHPQGSVLCWDALVSHDPRGQGRPFDWLYSELVVRDPDGSELARDRYRLSGETLAKGLPGITGGYQCQGSLIVVQRTVDQEALVAALREALPEGDAVYGGATRLPGGCGAWVRVLAQDAVALREALHGAWYAARRMLTGNEPAPRRK
jgi:urease accessory protein